MTIIQQSGVESSRALRRGVTQFDVNSAADAVLATGLRPTIERVRHHMGRGSPNTVGPMLDHWFKALGRRVAAWPADEPPGGNREVNSGATPPAVVTQALAALWDAALQAATEAFDAERLTVNQTAQSQVESAQREAATATARASTLHQEIELQRGSADRLRQEVLDLHIVRERLSQELIGAQAVADQLRVQLTEQQEAQRRQAAQTTEALALAEERTVAAERRAALDMDRERTTRGKAERRVDHLERALEELRGQSAADIQRLTRDLLTLESREQAWQARATAWELERQTWNRPPEQTQTAVSEARHQSLATRLGMRRRR